MPKRSNHHAQILSELNKNKPAPQIKKHCHHLYYQLKTAEYFFKKIDEKNWQFHLQELHKLSELEPNANYEFAYYYYFLMHSLRLLNLLENKTTMINHDILRNWRNSIRHRNNQTKAWRPFCQLTLEVFAALKKKDEKANCFQVLQKDFKKDVCVNDFHQEIKNIPSYEQEIKTIYESSLPENIKRDSILYLLSLLGGVKKLYSEDVNKIYSAVGHYGCKEDYQDFANNIYKNNQMLINKIIENVNKDINKNTKPLQRENPYMTKFLNNKKHYHLNTSIYFKSAARNKTQVQAQAKNLQRLTPQP